MRVLFLALMLALGGCATTSEPITPEPVIVKVPVYKEVPEPPLLTKPTLPIHSVKFKLQLMRKLIRLSEHLLRCLMIT